MSSSAGPARHDTAGRGDVPASSDTAAAADAEARTAEASSPGSTGDKYVLGVVLFAAGLFLLGIQARIGEFRLRLGIVVIAGILVVGTTAWLLTLPRLGDF